MKKITLILLMSIFILSCSKDDDTSNSKISINPPSWIQGTWVMEVNPYTGAEMDTYIAYKFTSNNMYILMDGLETNFVEMVKADPSFTLSDIYDVSTSTTYTIHVKGSGIDMVFYEFIKVSSNEIKEGNSDNSIYIKQ
ncbi:MAG: hypothetical protein Q8Q51_11570 [Lutibacter sp.]|nr:hypothetical protein [Lutibacter sp.]